MIVSHNGACVAAPRKICANCGYKNPGHLARGFLRCDVQSLEVIVHAEADDAELIAVR